MVTRTRKQNKQQNFSDESMSLTYDQLFLEMSVSAKGQKTKFILLKFMVHLMEKPLDLKQKKRGTINNLMDETISVDAFGSVNSRHLAELNDALQC